MYTVLIYYWNAELFRWKIIYVFFVVYVMKEINWNIVSPAKTHQWGVKLINKCWSEFSAPPNPVPVKIILTNVTEHFFKINNYIEKLYEMKYETTNKKIFTKSKNEKNFFKSGHYTAYNYRTWTFYYANTSHLRKFLDNTSTSDKLVAEIDEWKNTLNRLKRNKEVHTQDWPIV